MTIMSYSLCILPCVCGRACVIEKKLQERLRKVSFADSEKLKIIVKPGQGAPTHRKQNLRGFLKAQEKSGSLSMSQKYDHMGRAAAGSRKRRGHGEGLETVNGNLTFYFNGAQSPCLCYNFALWILSFQ